MVMSLQHASQIAHKRGWAKLFVVLYVLSHTLTTTTTTVYFLTSMETISDIKCLASNGISNKEKAGTMIRFDERKSGGPLPKSRTHSVAALSRNSVRVTAKRGAALGLTWLQSVTGILYIPPALVDTSVKAGYKSDYLARVQSALYLSFGALNAREDFKMVGEDMGHSSLRCCWLQSVTSTLYTPPGLVANKVKAGDKADILSHALLALYPALDALHARGYYELIYGKMSQTFMNHSFMKCSVYIPNINLLEVLVDKLSYSKCNVSAVRLRLRPKLVVNLVLGAGKKVLNSSGWTFNDMMLGDKPPWCEMISRLRSGGTTMVDSSFFPHEAIMGPYVFGEAFGGSLVVWISITVNDHLTAGDSHPGTKASGVSFDNGSGECFDHPERGAVLRPPQSWDATNSAVNSISRQEYWGNLSSAQPTMCKPTLCGSLAGQHSAHVSSSVRDAGDLTSLAREFYSMAIAPAFSTGNAGLVHILGANHQGHHASDTVGVLDQGLVVGAEAPCLQPYSSAEFPVASFPPSTFISEKWHVIPLDKNFGSSGLHQGWASDGHFDPGPLNAAPNISIPGTSAPTYMQARGRASTHTSPPLIWRHALDGNNHPSQFEAIPLGHRATPFRPPCHLS